MMDTSKYAIGYYPAPGDHCKWVHKDHIEKAPQWCSVDLRDGNQSLVIPMSWKKSWNLTICCCAWASRRSRWASPPPPRRSMNSCVP